MRPWHTFSLVIWLLGSAGTVLAGEDSERLEQLRQQIHKLELDIGQTAGSRDRARQQLTTLDREIGQMHRQLRQIQVRSNRGNHHLKKNRIKEQAVARDIRQQAGLLDGHLRTAYALGSQAQIKLLLNQERLDDLPRTLAYYRYLVSARADRVDTLQGRLQRLSSVQQEITQEQQQLTDLAGQKRREQAILAERAQERRQLVASLDRQLSAQRSEVARLKADEARLERLIQGIGALRPPPVSRPQPTGPFGRQRNKLRLPISGRLVARFGSRRRAGDQRWNGVFLAGREGQKVSAVYGGRVVFSGWLQGFGLLMILDHGDGYMTLYGHNRSLYKVVGDWVETGETIAIVGDTGNPPRTGLYFGVRQKGTPRNPLLWCRAGR